MTIDNAIDLYDPKRLDSLTREQLEDLPCGTIRVDENGIILFYSRAQAAIAQREPPMVLGRNFFTEVAPCTVVPEFYGRFRRGVLSGDLATSFEFVFDFEMEPVQVQITMRASERSGEYWIIVEPLQRIIPALPGFLAGLRALCDKHSVLLIFDEIVTGFRLAYGGAQERYGVVPDICTLGKIIGGGNERRGGKVDALVAVSATVDAGVVEVVGNHPRVEDIVEPLKVGVPGQPGVDAFDRGMRIADQCPDHAVPAVAFVEVEQKQRRLLIVRQAFIP